MKYKLSFYLLLVVLFALPRLTHAVDYYWVGGTGKWSEYQKHWATTSGGTNFHSIVPSAFDNVIFDSNSHTKAFQVTLDQTVISCNNLSFDIDGISMKLSGNTNINFNIYGSIRFHQNLEVDYSGKFILKSSNTGNTIAQRGGRFLYNNCGNFILDSPTGEWMISDSLSAYSFILENGKLNAAGKKIRLYEFISKNPNVRSINFLNTKAIIERFNVVGEKLTSDFSGSKITAQHVESYDYISISLDTVAVGPPSVFGTYTMGIYGTLKIKTVYYDKKGSALGFGNTNVTIDKLISNAEAISVRGKVLIKQSEFFNLRSLEIEDSDESIELDQTNLTGTDCGHYLTIFGKGKFIKKSGELNMNFVSIGGIEFTGGAVFKAYNSVDLGNNKGITISSASSATYYWIGGAGSWIDPLHWSLTSGGGPANCIPTALNDVIFDENSFTKDNEIIALGNNAVCRTIDLRGVQYSPVIKGYISIYGSLFLKKGTDISGVYRISFMSGSLNNRIDFAKTTLRI